jgi:hypothetical protein
MWGGQQIAQVSLLVEWHLTGSQSLASPVQSTVSNYTVNTIFNGALSNGAAGVPGGGSVKATCAPNVQPAAAAWQMVSYPGGCRLYDRTSYDHNH